MSSAIFIRLANRDDTDVILHLFRTTIESVCAKDYTPLQLAAWAGSADDKERWLKLIDEQFFYVAEIHEQLCGFASVTDEGYLDTLYVHKDFQDKGIASLLLNTIELKAKELGLTKIHTDASITAYPFFMKHGFAVTETYIKQRNGVEFLNRKMKKELKQG
jgi:GNAT superfamily N-acetyltransferase